tara:strand:+ start:1100 stop:1471 length:372 start_codon:yes stop_codon:yes gene_type:complete
MMMRYKEMNEEEEAVWVNLKIMAKLQPFEKLGTRRAHFEINPSTTIPEFLHRWWNGANRESDFNRIKDMYKKTDSLIEKHPDRAKKHIRESIKGLESLQKTYENDITMKARIDCLIDDVNNKL